MARAKPPPPPAPRWVKVVAFAGAVLLALLVVSMLFGGDHGPGRHQP